MNWLTNEDISSYTESRTLSEETSKSDPENEPFRSKYKARELLQDLKNKIECLIEEQPNGELSLMSASLQYHLGLNYAETEEISSGEEHLVRCNEKLEDHRLDHRCVALAISTLNQLGIIWCQRSETKKSLEFLKEAKTLYQKYTHDVDAVPWGIHDLFLPESSHKSDHERKEAFENIHTLTLYYLAQVYGMLGKKSKSAKLCHITLKRQLEFKQYTPMEWALHCATLSQFYITQDNYPLARHCLASASCIFQEVLQKHPEALETSGEEVDGDIEEIQHRKADIARCWLKYCLALLAFSKEDPATSSENHNNDEEEEQEEEDEESSDGEEEAGRSEDYKIPEKFDSLELGSWEDKVTDKIVTSFEEAREVFLAGQQFINESKAYYLFEGHVSDHIEIVKDHSQLFKILAQYETDLERQSKMHKRRIDMLTAILDELNPQFFLHICRQLTFEIAETYNAMVDIKTEIKNRSGTTPTAHVVKKINGLIMKSIAYFQKFCDSLRDPQGVMPEELEENLIRPTLLAHFYMGRLYANYLSPEMSDRIKNLETSCEHYKFVVDYCKKFPEASQKVQAELGICEEMVQFTPVRIDSLVRGVS
ncbi:KIF1-binding protein-like [Holothuria leucospilota]|uniref:KIF-binding protein n=1 Tax=Holothuria leucospilota TaxID=206669 RepID=A0A9Q1H8E1_HOLLE|nr:KIF1-binding protein-like [Holothuria leucospilota]